jgi:hypothetical protein
VAGTAEGRNAYTVSVVTPDVKLLLGRPRHMRQDSIKIKLKGIECEGVGWIILAQQRENVASSPDHENEILGSKDAENFLAC